MRKSKLLILSTIALLSLVGCGQNKDNTLPTTPEEIVSYVLNQIRGDSHELKVEEELKILRPNDKYSVDIYQHYVYQYGYLYSDNGVDVAKVEETSARYADLDKNTGLINEMTLRTASTPRQTYYRNNEDGTALLKAVNFQNEVETRVLAYQDEEEGTFIPVIYDDEFKNPFDYITTRDLVYNEENNTVVIDNSKTTFIANTYKAVGLNLINACYITLDDKFVPQTIEFDIPDLVESTYTRTNDLKVTFTNMDIEYYEVKAFNHKNDVLAGALKELEGAKNYTYYKNYVYEGQTYDLISGFYTEDMIYFHHGTIEDGDVYKKGDNYDYVAKKNSDNIFAVYDCSTEDGVIFNWNIVMASGTTPLTYETFEDCAPSYFDISANIFKDLGNNKYECEEQLLPTIGQYFDYGVWGVDSYALESQTNRCVITLTSEGKIDYVEIGFKLENIQYDIVYTYDNIGSTTIPSWLEFPH